MKQKAKCQILTKFNDFFPFEICLQNLKTEDDAKYQKIHLDETQKLKMFFGQHQSKDNFSTAFIKSLINVTFHKDTLIITQIKFSKIICGCVNPIFLNKGLIFTLPTVLRELSKFYMKSNIIITQDST